MPATTNFVYDFSDLEERLKELLEEAESANQDKVIHIDIRVRIEPRIRVLPAQVARVFDGFKPSAIADALREQRARRERDAAK